MKSTLYSALLILLSFSFYITAEGQNNVVDSLKRALRNQKEDTGRALTYTRISEHYANNGDIPNLFLYVDSAISLSKKLSFKKGEAGARENRGYGYLQLMKFDSAKNDFLASLGIREEIGDKKATAQSYHSLGIYYYDQDSLPEALESFYTAIKLFNEVDNKNGIAISLDMLGQIYHDQGDDSNALVNTQLASNTHLEAGNHLAAAYSKSEMGLIEFDQYDYEMALKYYMESLGLSEKYGASQADIAYYYLLIGDVYMKQGEIALSKGDPADGSQKYRQAMAMYDSSGRKYKESNRMDGLVSVGGHAAKIYIQLKEFSKAEKLLDEFLHFSLANKNKADIADAYSSLAVLDSAVGNYNKALNDFKASVRYRDSVSAVRNNRKLVSLVMKHEYDKREAEAKVLQTTKDTEAREARNKQKLAIISLILMIVTIFAFALIQWRNNKAKQRANKLLENTLDDLKSTQNQLIQSEKLASLGELTAGIAHEIQNPLNFVNNFSEVNTELILEMQQEIDSGNLHDVKNISNVIQENEQKINHHGKRADAIVKSMLQHSQLSAGKKEPTDINTVADEYLRLAYHGYRAKEKSFNIIMKTNYDGSIGKINIITQDMGRVLVNLYNNAFYAVSDRKKQLPEGYEPTVSVSTKKIDGKIEIRVRDNGNGIQQNIVNKIFQPFFTTKPTGQGTGLGLSLSYDIIKAHGGEIKVDTGEGEFTEFVVQIPAN